MSTQSIAAETIVVTELQDLYAAESALEKAYNQLRFQPDVQIGAEAFFARLAELEERASRLENILAELDGMEARPKRVAIC